MGKYVFGLGVLIIRLRAKLHLALRPTLFAFIVNPVLGTVRKLRKHIGVLSWSEKGNFCLFSVLKRGTY